MIAEWRHAYRVLDVPESATPQTIQIAWRRLVKQWGPDHCPGGIVEQADRTRMVEILNGAYGSIQAAPLLTYGEVACAGSSQHSAASAAAWEETPQIFR